MTTLKRDTWLLIAGLPGVVAPFVPFMSWIAGDLTLVDLVSWGGAVTALTLTGFVPLFVAPWQLYRAVTGRESVAWRVVAWFLAAVATIAAVVGDLMHNLSLGWAFFAYGFIVANSVLLLYGAKRGRAPDVLAESFLLGTYVVTATPWILVLMIDQGDRIAPWLIAWTCLAYIATIVIRLRASNRVGAS